MSVQAGHTALTKFLERAGVPYEVVEHERTQTAGAEARAAGMPPSDVAKTVVLRDEEGCGSPWSLVGAARHAQGQAGAGVEGLRLVSEQEMAEEFDEFEVGAVPPFGPMFQGAGSGGSAPARPRPHLVLRRKPRAWRAVDPNDVVKAGRARVADICED